MIYSTKVLQPKKMNKETPWGEYLNRVERQLYPSKIRTRIFDFEDIFR